MAKYRIGQYVRLKPCINTYPEHYFKVIQYYRCKTGKDRYTIVGMLEDTPWSNTVYSSQELDDDRWEICRTKQYRLERLNTIYSESL